MAHDPFDESGDALLAGFQALNDSIDTPRSSSCCMTVKKALWPLRKEKCWMSVSVSQK